VKLTNKFNLPQTILNVIARPTYTKGKANFSVTELLTSPRIVQLKRKHWDALEEDAADMVWSLFGSAIHGVLEHGKGENHIVEERIHLDIDGTHISGAIDLQEVEEDGIILSDYKTTSAWVVQNMKQDWHDQLNIYAYLVGRLITLMIVSGRLYLLVSFMSLLGGCSGSNVTHSMWSVNSFFALLQFLSVNT